MIKIKDIKKPLQKGKGETIQSSIEERWSEDAKWFKEDAKKHPEKYQAKNDEKHVSSEEAEEYLENFIKEGNTPYSVKGEIAHRRTRPGRAFTHKAKMRALTRSKNNRSQIKTKRYLRKKQR